MEMERVKRKLGGGGVAETTTSTGTERVALWWWYIGGAYASAHRRVKTKLNGGEADDDEIWILI
ncbi:hypothetical protein F2Q69_00051104 [Brassica cretica]|uniref:Uncharacterized protein n=1 Tax=Brassica cretica TaxID=69181 RepID=A0A8S9PS53_BRACR|nr:hypothetical protein F2Q69_00051104 [Brassica cretica]